MKKHFSIVCVLTALSMTIHSYGQESKKVVLEENYRLKKNGFFSKFELHVPIPEDYEGRQRIDKIEYEPFPDYRMKIGTVRYAVFELDEYDLKRYDKISIRLELSIFDYDLAVAREKPLKAKLKKRERKRYLATTGLYKLNEEHRSEKIFDDSLFGVDKVWHANEIHDFVVEHLEYKTFFGEDKGARYAYETNKGDCTEYADLMVALCRANNIPARRVGGYTINRDTTSFLSRVFRSSGHAWVELYFDEYGWVPFDPTHSDGSRTTNFGNLSTKYVYTKFSDQDRGCHWKWWGTGRMEVDIDRKVLSVENREKNELTKK